MMFKLRAAIVSVIALVLTVVVPLQTAPASAEAPATFTKTVTVLGVDGQPYAGAQVALIYTNTATQSWVPTTPVTTNSSGVATIVASSANFYQALSVEPPLSDTTSALYTSRIGAISKVDQALSVTLSPANMRVKLLSPNNSDAPVGSYASPPSDQVGGMNKATITVRTGAFGLAVSTTVTGDQEIPIGGATDVDAANRSFALQITGTGSGATRVLHSDDNLTSSPLAAVNGVYPLQLRGEDIHGVLRNAGDTSNVTLPSGVQGRVVFTPANSDGSLNRGYQGPRSSLFNSDGTFVAGLPSLKPGKYFSQVLIGGSATIPSFTGPAIWINSSGNYSMTESGTYLPASSFVYKVLLPSTSPNLVVRQVGSNNLSEASYIDLSDDGNQGNWWGPNATSNGIAAYVLPSGNYWVSGTPFDVNEVNNSMGYRVIVDGNSVEIRDDHNTVVTPTSAGNYTFHSARVNLLLQVTNPDGSGSAVSNANVDVRPGNGNSIHGYSDAGTIAMAVPNGTYTLQVTGGNDGSFASKNYDLVVNSDGFTVSEVGGSAIAAVGGYVPVTPNLATAKFKIMDPRANASTVLTNASVDLQAASGEWVDGGGTWDQPVGLHFDDGVYTLQVQGFSYPDLATAVYSLTKSGSTLTLRAPDGSLVSPVSPGVYEVFPSLPNITFVVKSPASPNNTLNTGWVEIFNSATNNWVARSDMRDGVASFSLANGRYNVRVNPGGSGSGLAASSYTLEMTSTGSTLKKSDGTTVALSGGNYVVFPQSANVNLVVEHPTTHSALNSAWVDVFQLDEARNSRDWVTNGNSNSGPIGLSLADGHYVVQVNDASGDTTLAAQRYELTVSNSGGTVELKTWSGTVVSPQNGQFTVSPQGANLMLRVVNPDAPTQPLRQAYVNIRDAVTGQWLPGTGVNNLGQAGFNVDPGSYVLEVHPGGNAVGLATKSYNLVVANDRSVTLTPASGSAALVKNSTTSIFDVTVAAANVKFNVVTPSSSHALLEQAWINIFNAQGNNRGDWVANSNGSHPGFALGNGNYIAEVNPGNSDEDLANKLYKVTVGGATVTVSTLTNVSVPAEINGSFTVQAATANVALTLVDPSDSNVLLTQSWVNIQNRDTNSWVAGTGTNRGLVSLNLPEGHYTVEVNPGSTISGLAQKKYNLDIDSSGIPTITGAPLVNGRFTLTAAAANFLLKIVDPNDATRLMTNGYVNVQRASDGMWIAGTGGNTGRLALRLEDGTYNLQVDPGQTPGVLLARKTYSVTVSGQGATVAVADKSATAGVFTLEVANPAIGGVVNDDQAAPVPNSWVVPTNKLTNEQLWQLGANSNSSGAFGIAVPDGAYDVTANVPWNSGYNLAKSAPCSVTVSNGAVTTTVGGCVQSNKSLVLALRAPNLKFTLVDPTGHALANANVSIQYGAWNIWANSNEAGQVALFIDPVEIKAANPNASGPINLSAYLDPPYGNSDVVRSQCTKGVSDQNTLCAQLRSITLPTQLNGTYASYAAQDLGDISLTAPNTRLTVVHPDNSAVTTGGWVNLFKEVTSVCTGCRNYIGSSNTGSAGVASFNVTDTTGTFAVEVNAPNSERESFASKTYTGLTWAQVNSHSFSLATPNLKLSVRQPGGSASRWAWMSVETLDGAGHTTGWLGGYGTNELGVASALIPNSGTFRLTFFPGGGSTGARTICDVTSTGSVVSLVSGHCTDGALVGSNLTLTLSLGNLTGTITHNGGALLAGAIVRAEWAGDINNPQPAQTFTTAADGKYGFQLAPGSWRIKVYYVNDPEAGFTITQDPDGALVTVGNTSSTYDKVLVG